MTKNITKRSGQKEAFQLEKIRESMRNADVSQELAQKIVAGISYHEGITTSEVRSQVIAGIKNREPRASKQYESHPKKTHEI